MTTVHQELALLLLCSIVGIGCGPTIEPLDDETGSTGTVPPDSATASSTAPPPPPPPSTSTTSTTSTSTTAVDGSDESDEVGFIERIDGGNCLVADDGTWHCSQCDPFVQDCPSEEKCTVWANDGGAYPNATRCVPIVEEPIPPGQPCTVEDWPASGIDDCELGALCWNPDPESLMGTCVSLCTGDSSDPQCPAAMSCLVEQDGAVVVCLPDCDPLVNDCGPGEACIPAEEGFVCTGAWDAPAGEPCDFFDVCAPGLVCLDVRTVAPSCVPGFAGCCTPWCDLSAPDPSADCFDPAQECVSWWDGPPPAGYETLGACVVPAP